MDRSEVKGKVKCQVFLRVRELNGGSKDGIVACIVHTIQVHPNGGVPKYQYKDFPALSRDVVAAPPAGSRDRPPGTGVLGTYQVPRTPYSTPYSTY